MNVEKRLLELGGVFPPNIPRRVHRVDWYPNFITLVQLDNSPISQREYHIFDGNPLRARDRRPKSQGFPNDHVQILERLEVIHCR